MSHPLIELLTAPRDAPRLTWHEYFAAQALLTAMRSPSSKLRVGAVIVKDNRVVSTGYNGYISGAPHESIHVNGHEVNTIHAEQNAVADSSKRGVSVNGATIYVTHYPCLNCTKMILASGIARVYYIHNYHNDTICANLFYQANVEVHQLFV